MQITNYLMIALLQAMIQIVQSSVIPKPNYKMQQSTTQIANIDKNYSSGEGTIIVVTSSELPKQIPPPPTPTRPHEATPRYETQWVTKVPFFGGVINEKHTLASFHMPYNALERADVFQNLL